MAANMWFSKEDVLKDLAECSGNGVADFDDDFVVRGTRPPPRHKSNDDEIDEEFNLRFGGCGLNGQATNGIVRPDLVGIQHMLRIVDGNEKPQEKLPPKHKSTSPRKQRPGKEETIVISKLNPNVPEFIPQTSNHIEDKEIKNVVLNEELEASHKDKMIADLKSKIRDTSDQDSHEKRLKRNVAMAALVRLHSKPTGAASNTTPNRVSPSEIPTAPTPTVPPTAPAQDKTPVLFTPDYFAGPVCCPTLVKVDDVEHNITEPKPLLETDLKTPSPREMSDPYVKESIKKVNNWLSSPEIKAKPAPGPVLYLGNVSLKKKESPNGSNCPSVVSTSTKKPARQAIPSYVPSAYAKELADDLKKRAQAKEEKAKKSRPVNLWDKLEQDLKARDKIIKERSMQCSQNNS